MIVLKWTFQYRFVSISLIWSWIDFKFSSFIIRPITLWHLKREYCFYKNVKSNRSVIKKVPCELPQRRWYQAALKVFSRSAPWCRFVFPFSKTFTWKNNWKKTQHQWVFGVFDFGTLKCNEKILRSLDHYF